MKLKLLPILALFCTFASCADAPSEDHSLTYIMDMVHRNPGEPLQNSKYYNEEYVKSQGYNSIVSQIYVQCALTYDDFEQGVIPEGSKEREWILKQREEVAEKIKRAKDAGLDIYTFTDVLVLPTMLIEKYQDQLVDDKDVASKSNIHGKLAPNIDKELTVTLIKAQIDEIFKTFPDLDGIVVRFGETYLYDTPYHSGSSPVRVKGDGALVGQVKLINLLRSEICEKHNKKLFYRTWGDKVHTSPELYEAITDRVATHENLIFSIKYTSGDFHRLARFNQTLGIGKHPYIIEFQAQPEYYGKGAHPAYMFGSLLNGFPEYSRIMKDGETQSMAELKGDPKFVGLWSWSRGGGWCGPYINHELWCDINAQSMATWAQDTTQTESMVLDKVLSKLGVRNNSVDKFKELLDIVDEAVLTGQHSNLGMKFNVWWTRDQYFYSEKYLSPFYTEAVETNRVTEVIEEKDRAMEMWDRIVELSREIKMKNPIDEEYLRISAEYGRIKYDIIRQIYIICLNSKNYELNGELNKEQTRTAIKRYDELWAEWKELEDNNAICANTYEPNGFKLSIDDGVSGNPETGIGSTVDKVRKLVE